MSDNEIFDKLKSFIGYETEVTEDDPIEAGMIRRFAQAIGDDNRLYYDEEYAHKGGFTSIIAPPTFVFEWKHSEALRADETGAYIADYRLPPRFVRAGNEYEFINPLCPGDIITTKSKIKDVYQKQRASGETMVFIVSESTYINQRQAILGIQRGVFIVFA